MEYRTKSRCKFLIKLHFVFVVKYRKSLLLGKLNEDLQQIVFEICSVKGWRIDAMESDKNHLHLLLDIEPQVSASEIAHRTQATKLF